MLVSKLKNQTLFEVVLLTNHVSVNDTPVNNYVVNVDYGLTCLLFNNTLVVNWIDRVFY